MPNFHRRSLRLKNWDYSQPGAYFVTIVAQNRACLFGNILNDEMQLNPAGQRLATEWEALPSHFPSIELDEWIIMPNHFHGIVVINHPNVGATLVVAPDDPKAGRAGTRPAPTQASTAEPDSEAVGNPTLGNIVGAFKSLTTDAYIQGVKNLNWQRFNKRLWQRNFYEHIIRNERDLDAIRNYIANNPLKWALDEENPQTA